MTDMDKAAGRVRKALVSHEKIAVFGDYDVDGHHRHLPADGFSPRAGCQTASAISPGDWRRATV